MLDLRPDSPTFGQWVGTNLTAENRCLHYLPAGLAHGFQTLSDDTEVFYQISEFYVPELARGVRWDDPAFAIAWPLTVTSISAKDRAHPDFDLQGMRIDPPTSACSPERVAPRGHAETRTV